MTHSRFQTFRQRTSRFRVQMPPSRSAQWAMDSLRFASRRARRKTSRFNRFDGTSPVLRHRATLATLSLLLTGFRIPRRSRATASTTLPPSEMASSSPRVSRKNSQSRVTSSVVQDAQSRSTSTALPTSTWSATPTATDSQSKTTTRRRPVQKAPSTTTRLRYSTATT